MPDAKPCAPNCEKWGGGICSCTAVERGERPPVCTVDADALLREGGDWLAAARGFVQRKALNGNSVTWGSGEAVSLSMGQLEEMAARAVAADRSTRTLQGLDRRCADMLADEVDVLVRQKVIDMRSPAADALLDYRNPPQSWRSDRLVELDQLVRRLLALTADDHELLGLLATPPLSEVSPLVEMGPWLRLLAEFRAAVDGAPARVEPSRSDGDHVYIGVRSCGCVVAAVVDMPDRPEEAAEAVAEMIRDGLTIERVHADDERNRTDRCAHAEGEEPRG